MICFFWNCMFLNSPFWENEYLNIRRSRSESSSETSVWLNFTFKLFGVCRLCLITCHTDAILLSPVDLKCQGEFGLKSYNHQLHSFIIVSAWIQVRKMSINQYYQNLCEQVTVSFDLRITTPILNSGVRFQNQHWELHSVLRILFEKSRSHRWHSQ